MLEIIETIVGFALIAVVMWGATRLSRYWITIDSIKQDAAAWTLLKWSTESLVAYREKLVPLCTLGKGADYYRRQVKAVDMVLEYRAQNVQQKAGVIETPPPTARS